MADIDRIMAAARAWLAFIGDLDYSPTIVPFGDPGGAEKRARYELASVLRDELFRPERHGPIYLWSSEGPLRGQHQHWGGSDIWRCDEHPDWQGEEYGTWEAFRDYRLRRGDHDGPESALRREWDEESVEAHAALHDVSLQ